MRDWFGIAGLPPFEPIPDQNIPQSDESDDDSEVEGTVPTTVTATTQKQKQSKAVHHLSFETYYETWKNLATSTEAQPSSSRLSVPWKGRLSFRAGVNDELDAALEK